jgi:hypothetical protein
MKLPPKGSQPSDDYNVYSDFDLAYLEDKGDALKEIESGSAGFRDTVADCRIQASKCYKGKVLGLVVRGQKGGNVRVLPSSSVDRLPELDDDFPEFVTGYEPNRKLSGEFLNSIREICCPLFRLLFPGGYARKGLLIVSGATNSSKTQIANGLIHLYLQERMQEWWQGKTNRKPHLVTFEDPIETYLVDWATVRAHNVNKEWNGWAGSEHWSNWWRFPDYTPREKGLDVVNLNQAVSDALRQTPAVFYSTETRLVEDWEHLFKLAESHLVVTTTHSSSIIAAFNSLLAGLHVKTPTERSELASVLLGIVHMRPAEEKKTGLTPVLYNIPSLWRRTAYATKAFAAEGMSSLVPTYVESLEKAGTLEFYYLGRQTFAKFLTDRAARIGPENEFIRFAKEGSASASSVVERSKPGARHPAACDLTEAILYRAVDLDLRGE